MASPEQLRRRASAAFAAVFVPSFLGAVLLQNLGGYLRRDLPLLEEATIALGALGAHQRWPMFGAYFPNHTRVPVVRILLTGGTPVFLEPIAAPSFQEELARRFDLDATSEPGRVAAWKTHVGTGRIEKIESRASSPWPGWLGVRTAYVASRMRRWADAEGVDLARQVRAVDLLSVKIRSARDGVPLTVVSIDPVSIEPALLPDWPAPRARQLVSGRP